MDRSKRNCATRGSAPRRGGCPPTSSRRRRPAAAVASPRWHRAALWEWRSMGSAPDRHGSEARSIARSRLRRPAAGSSHGRSGNHARTRGSRPRSIPDFRSEVSRRTTQRKRTYPFRRSRGCLCAAVVCTTVLRRRSFDATSSQDFSQPDMRSPARCGLDPRVVRPPRCARI